MTGSLLFFGLEAIFSTEEISPGPVIAVGARNGVLTLAQMWNRKYGHMDSVVVCFRKR